jgi:hypothetical protein
VIFRWVVAFVVGGLWCYVLDHQHVVWNVLSYPDQDFWQQAWWVPLLFGTSTVLALLAVEPIRRLVRGGLGETPSAALVVADFASFSAAYYLTAVAHRTPDLLLLILVGTWVIRVAAGMPAWGVAYCIGAALVGPAVEATISGLGLFHYHHPDFLGFARWLPGLYLHVGVLAVTLGQRMRSGVPVGEPIEIEVIV